MSKLPEWWQSDKPWIIGDCLEGMRELPDNVIPLTVTSPPYDDLRTYGGYSFDFKGIAKEIYRITKDGGVVVWVVGDETKNGNESGTSFRQALYFKEIGFNLHDTMIYEKHQACFGSNKCYLQSFEYMFVLSKGGPETINLIRDRKNRRAGVESVGEGGLSKDGLRPIRIKKEMKEFGKRKNIWRYGVGGGNTNHPAPFPDALAKDHILSWSNEGDIVLDPMCGSGTVLKMCRHTDRIGLGFEINPDYEDIIRTRSLENIKPLEGYVKEE